MFSTHLDHRFALGLAAAVLTVGIGVVANTDVQACDGRATPVGGRRTALSRCPVEPGGCDQLPDESVAEVRAQQDQLRPGPTERPHARGHRPDGFARPERSTPSTTAPSPHDVRRAANATLSGNALYLTMPDKTYYFYAHLSKFADGLTAGTV
jgi:hypothetical protein